MSRTSEPPNDPMARLDTQRCDTRVIDVQAMRAIHAAFVSGTERASAAGANDAAASGADGADAPDTLVDPAPPIQAHAAREAKERARGPMEREGLARPELVAEAPQLSTVEVDYSPAVRLRRARSAKVQRTARIATAACIVLAGGIGLWAAVRAGSKSAPPADSMPAAQSSALVAEGPAAATARPASSDASPQNTAPRAALSVPDLPAAGAQAPATVPVLPSPLSATVRASEPSRPQMGRPSLTGAPTAAPPPRPSVGPRSSPPAPPLDPPIPE